MNQSMNKQNMHPARKIQDGMGQSIGNTMMLIGLLARILGLPSAMIQQMN